METDDVKKKKKYNRSHHTATNIIKLILYIAPLKL